MKNNENREFDLKELEELENEEKNISRDNESNDKRNLMENRSTSENGSKRRDGKKDKKVRKNTGFLKFYGVMATIVIGALALSTAFFAGKSKGGTTIIYQDGTTVKTSKTLSSSKDSSEEKYDDAESLKAMVEEYMTEGKGTMAMLREMFPEKCVVYSNNQFLFLDVNEDLPQNDLDNDNFTLADDGTMTYKVDGKTKSHMGIDVSKYQGDIDWEKVAASGIEFAMIRVGYRGYGTGAIVEDEKAKANIEGAKKAGLKVGVYFFTQAITEDEAEEEAEFVINFIKDYDIEYPVVFDTEDVPGQSGRTDELSVEERTNIAYKFCKCIEEADYEPEVYSNLKWYMLSLNADKLADYKIWLAAYDSDLYFPYKLGMWQYSEGGTVDGISTTVDFDIAFED